MARKGMGQGRGKGYKNMVGGDSKIHSLSAKGVKQPQKLNIAIAKIPVLGMEEKEAMTELGKDDFFKLKKMLKVEFDSKIDSFREEENGVYNIELESGEEFYLFKDNDTAERKAEDRVREDLENEPELFTQSWLQNYYSMSDTDRRILAGDLTDSYASDIRSEDDGLRLADESGNKDEYDEIQEQIDESEDDEKTSELETKKEELLDKAETELQEKQYDDVYESLDDPYNYLVEEQGMYSAEDFYKASFMSLDVEDAVSGAISEDGWQHFIATYDGNSLEVPESDLILARTN